MLAAEELGPVVVMVTVAPVEVVAKLQVDSEGSPEQVNAKDWLKPSRGVMLSVALPLCPGLATLMLDGLALIWKSTTCRVAAVDVDPL